MADEDFEEVKTSMSKDRWVRIMGDVWRKLLELREQGEVSVQRVLEAFSHIEERVTRACINEFVKAKALIQQGEVLLFANTSA